MTVLLYGERDRGAPNDAVLGQCIAALTQAWQGKPELLVLLVRARWQGVLVDIVCISPQGLLLLQCEEFAGTLEGGEQGAWCIEGEPLEQESQANPYQQLALAKEAVQAYLNESSLLQGQKTPQVRTAVVFSMLTQQRLSAALRAKNDFFVRDVAHCAPLLVGADRAANSLSALVIPALLERLAAPSLNWHSSCNKARMPLRSDAVARPSMPPMPKLASALVPALTAEQKRAARLFRSVVMLAWVVVFALVAAQVHKKYTVVAYQAEAEDKQKTHQNSDF